MEGYVIATLIDLLVTYYPLSLLGCGVLIWLCLRGVAAIREQSTIAHEMHTLIERDGSVTVELSERQIRYLQRWGFEIGLIEPRDGGLWLSEVTQ